MIAYLALPRTPPSQPAPGENNRGGRLSRAQAETAARLETVALELFEENGFEATTTDQLAQRAGVSRRTFFRYFPSKEDVVFSHHVDHLDHLNRYLEEATDDAARSAAHALQTVVDEYVDDTDLVRRRTRLVRATPALRDREVLWLDEYQRLIGDYLAADTTRTWDSMYAQVVAAALIATLRQVLTGWAESGFEDDPRPVFTQLADSIVNALTAIPTPAAPPNTTEVVILNTSLTPAKIAELLTAAE